MDSSFNTTALSPMYPTPDPTYQGGKVLDHPVFSNIFVGPYWKSTAGSADRDYLDKFSHNIVKSAYIKSWKEYGVQGAQAGPSANLNAPTKQNRFTAVDIQHLILQGLNAGALKQTSAQNVFTLFLPPGMILLAPDGSTSLEGLGGYHFSFDSAKYGRVYYAVIAYSKGANGIPFSSDPRKNITITTSHEWTEVATDPDVNNGELGWYDDNYGEISDITMDVGMPLKEAYGSVGGYSVQKNWSNRDQRFEVRPK